MSEDKACKHCGSRYHSTPYCARQVGINDCAVAGGSQNKGAEIKTDCPTSTAAAVGEGISAEQFYYEHRRKHKVDAHYNLVNMRGIFEFAEAYAGELRKERDALKKMLWHQIYRNHEYTEVCGGCQGAKLEAEP